MATDYAKKTNAELVEILKSRGLPHGGKKADMVSRLQENDNASTAAPAQTENADDVIDWEDDEVPTAGAAAAAKPAEAAAPAPAESAVPQAEGTKTEEAAQSAEAAQEGGAEAAAAGTAEEQEAQQPAEEKPAPNFSIGLSVTDLEEELKKRKARAEKFGITEESQAAIDSAEKKLERAKRFGTADEEAPSVESVSRLDQALPERSRKRGHGDNEQGGRGGKRRNFQGRNNQRNRGRGNRNQGQNQKQGQSQKSSTNNAAANGLSEKDKAALEARKKRFAAAA